jgi:AsmA family
MRLLLSVLALLALVVGGLAALWWLGGPDAHRWMARRTLELFLGREIHVDGTLELKPGAEPLLQVTGVRIDSPSWAETPNQLQIARAQIQIALRPLLRRVLVFPLIDLEGITVALETAVDGRHSWQPDDGQVSAPPAETGFAIPLFDRLSVKDATVSYHDRRDGRRTRLHVESLIQRRGDASGDMRLEANGDIDGRNFRIGGTSGSLESALAATEPWPLDLEIQLPSIDGKLTGTVADVAQTSGLDLRVEARSPSLLAAATTWHLSLPADLQTTVGATLGGDLAALSLVDVRAEMNGSGGDRLELSGSLGNVWEGSGLDGRMTLKLDPAGQFGKVLPALAHIANQIEAAASIAGSVAAPLFEGISADIQGPGGSRLKLAGSVRAATAGGVRLHSFDLTSVLDVPDPSAFADRLGFDPARLGALRGSADLSSTNQRIEARRLEIDAREVGAFHLEGRGAIGTLAADGALRLAPDISFAATMAESRPLLDLIDPNAPELGPVHATGRLVRADQGYRLDDFELDLGTADKLAISAQGKAGPLVPDDLRTTELDLAVRFGWPSSQILRPLVGADLPELGKAEGEFGLGGTIASLRIHDARLTTESDAGVAVTATGGIASVQTTTPLAVKGVALELEAQARSTALLARLLGHESPDFGPVHARASLGDAQGPLALSAIRLVAGPAAAPSIEASGAIGDVLSFEKVELQGDFRIAVKDLLLAFADVRGNSDVGTVHGKVHLSDADGSMGLEHLQAEVRETRLLSLTVEGLIDDLEKLDQVRFQTSLEIPHIAQLAEVFDVGGAGLERFRFAGKLSGDGRRFDADGRAILGNTQFDGVLSGDFRGARPSFKARLHSPQVRLVILA